MLLAATGFTISETRIAAIIEMTLGEGAFRNRLLIFRDTLPGACWWAALVHGIMVVSFADCKLA
jgi:hypothetical protein